MKLSSLLAALPDYHLPPTSPYSGSGEVDPDPFGLDVTHITADSRQVKPGALFVAYRGVQVDGHDYIGQAVANGAVAVVCETASAQEAARRRPEAEPAPALSPAWVVVPDGREALAYLAAAWHNFPARRLVMVGITGTDGKTTTTNFLYHMLRAAGKKVSMINTVSAVIGDSVLETGLHTTTPDAPDVQRYLAQMVEAHTEVCLLEVTSHGLAHHRVTACDFDVAVVTNITHEHLDLHGSLDAYRAAKVKLFESLASAANKGFPKAAVLNCDDASFSYLKETVTRNGTPWYGYSLADHPEAALAAEDIATGPDKTTFTVSGPGYTFQAETSLLGDYNVSNCLAAATAAIEALGASVEPVRQGIAALPGVPGRLERIDAGQDFMAVVDFAHTPNSLRRSLMTARRLTPGRVMAVFGCAGLRDVEKRALMGQIAADLADMTILTAEDPRTESLPAIIEETARAMRSAGAVEGRTFEREPDRGRAIYRAVQSARPGDVVIVLGKGHEQSMCFGQVEYPWDDREAVRSALLGRPLLTLPTGG